MTTLQHGALVRDDAATGHEVTIISDKVDRDFWVKTDDGWKLQQERRLSHHATKNGVPVK